jgi:CrcB protein
VPQSLKVANYQLALVDRGKSVVMNGTSLTLTVPANGTVAFPIGTVTVNVTGAFALGLVSGLGLSHGVTTLIGTGFLGAYTTFSGWMLETRSLAEDRRWRAAAANTAVSVVAGLAAAFAGHWLGVAAR